MELCFCINAHFIWLFPIKPVCAVLCWGAQKARETIFKRAILLEQPQLNQCQIKIRYTLQQPVFSNAN